MSNSLFLDNKCNDYSVFELPEKLQVSIIADALRKGTEPADLLLVNKRLLPIIAAAVNRVLCEITADVMAEIAAVTRGAFNLDKITSLLPLSEGSNPDTISIEPLAKVRKAIGLLAAATKAMAIAHAHFELVLPHPGNLLVNLNMIEDDHQESNENLQKIWNSRLWKALDSRKKLQQLQGLIMPAIDAPAKTIQVFLNNPAHIFLIKDLKILDLDSLELTILPREIGTFTNLQKLYLTNNQLRYLPHAIGNLINLQVLVLSYNQLHDLPQVIGKLTKLQRLSLTSNQFHDFPPVIGNLTKLEFLYFANNQLHELPQVIGNLKKLQRLNLHNNQLHGLPQVISNLKNLQELDLSNNLFQYLPQVISNLKNLKVLDLHNNQLHDFPPVIGNLKNLQKLNLENNQLHDFPPVIGNLKNLQLLYLNNNQLHDLSPLIGNLKNLQKLNLENNQLYDLPQAIGNLTNLQELGLSNNLFQYLPPVIGKLRKLQKLYLNNNQHGKTRLFIPDEFFALTKTLNIEMSALNSQPLDNTFASPFAQLYQSFLTAPAESSMRIFSDNFSEEKKNLIYGVVCNLAERNDLEWGKANAFKDMSRLQKAVGLLITIKFHTLSQDEKGLVYDHIWFLAGEPEADRWGYWGEKHALDSLAFLAEAMSKLDT